MAVVAVCGTPGTGKSTVLKRLQGRLQRKQIACRFVNVSQLVKQERLYDHYDDDMDACVMDSAAVKRRLAAIIAAVSDGEHVVIETHTPSVLPKKLMTACVVLQCQTHVLFDRLTERNYSGRKREENVQAEIMQVVLEEATERLGCKRVRCMQNDTKEDLTGNLKGITRLLR